MSGTETQVAATKVLLEQLWQRSLPVLMERLDILDAAAEEARSGLLAKDLRTQAIMESHKLAGSLGMFGYSEGTRLARVIEVLLEAPGEPDSQEFVSLTTALRASLFGAA